MSNFFRLKVWCCCCSVRASAITATVLSVLYSFLMMMFSASTLLKLAGANSRPKNCTIASNCETCLTGQRVCLNERCACLGNEPNIFAYIVTVIFLILAVAFIVACVCLFIAVCRDKGEILVLIWLALTMGGLVVGTIVYIIEEIVDAEDVQTAIVLVIVFSLLICIVDIFLIYVWIGVLNYYWLLKGRRLGDSSYYE